MNIITLGFYLITKQQELNNELIELGQLKFANANGRLVFRLNFNDEIEAKQAKINALKKEIKDLQEKLSLHVLNICKDCNKQLEYHDANNCIKCEGLLCNKCSENGTMCKDCKCVS